MLLALLVVPACGGEDESAPAPAPAGGTVVAALGDSITAGSPRWDPNPDIREQIGSQLDRRSQYELWAERALPDTDFRNCGVPGQLTDEIARRLEACAEGADVLIIQGGVNDLGSGRSPVQIAANLRGMVREGKRHGLRVALVELLPWNRGYPVADPLVRDVNRRIARIARACECCPGTGCSRIRGVRGGCATSGPTTSCTRRWPAIGGSASPWSFRRHPGSTSWRLRSDPKRRLARSPQP